MLHNICIGSYIHTNKSSCSFPLHLYFYFLLFLPFYFSSFFSFRFLFHIHTYNIELKLSFLSSIWLIKFSDFIQLNRERFYCRDSFVPSFFFLSKITCKFVYTCIFEICKIVFCSCDGLLYACVSLYMLMYECRYIT